MPNENPAGELVTRPLTTGSLNELDIVGLKRPEPRFRRNKIAEESPFSNMITTDWIQKYETQFQELEILIDTPPSMLAANLGLPKECIPDELTGLPYENEAMQNLLEEELARAIREDANWMYIFSDVDNLKVANTKYGFPFGDVVARYGGSTFAEAIIRSNLSEKVKVYPARANQAGDEFIALITDLTPEEAQRVRLEMATILETKKVKDPDFEFSTSVQIVDPAYPAEGFTDYIQETRNWLNEDESNRPTILLTEINSMAKEDVGFIKDLKDLARLPVKELLEAENMTKFREIMLSRIGNSRIGDKLLDVIMRFSAEADQAIRNDLPRTAAFVTLLDQMGVPSEKIALAHNSDQLIEIWHDLFGPTRMLARMDSSLS